MTKSNLTKAICLVLTAIILVGCGSGETQGSTEKTSTEQIVESANTETNETDTETQDVTEQSLDYKAADNNVSIDNNTLENQSENIEETSDETNNKESDAETNEVLNHNETANKDTQKEFNALETDSEADKNETKAYTFPFDNTRDLSQPFLNTEPNKLVILDVDMNTDVDDVCAVRMATTLDDLGVIDLKAVCYCTDHSSQGALRGILHHDGKDDVLMGQGNEDRYEESPYWNELGKHNDWGGNFERSVRQYRKVLASATSPVDIVTTGQVTNIEELLKSGPDDISPLTGMELVKTKVGQLYVVGGDYPEGWSNNLALTSAAVQATKYMIDNWPLPIIYSPGQVGGKMVCGKYLQDLDTQRLDPVTRSLWAFGTPCGRAAWDPFGVWLCGYACGPENQVDLIRISTGINDGGGGWMTENPNGKDFMVALKHNDLNYYNQTMDNHLIYMLTKIYGIENPNKEPIGLR